MIRSRDIPELIRKRLPDFADVVDFWLEGEAPENIIYTILANVVVPLRARLDQDPQDLKAVSAFQELFDLAEEALQCGDSSAQDLFVLEVVQELADPKIASLGLRVGPLAAAEFAKFREWRNTPD